MGRLQARTEGGCPLGGRRSHWRPSLGVRWVGAPQVRIPTGCVSPRYPPPLRPQVGAPHWETACGCPLGGWSSGGRSLSGSGRTLGAPPPGPPPPCGHPSPSGICPQDGCRQLGDAWGGSGAAQGAQLSSTPRTALPGAPCPPPPHSPRIYCFINHCGMGLGSSHRAQIHPRGRSVSPPPPAAAGTLRGEGNLCHPLGSPSPRGSVLWGIQSRCVPWARGGSQL